MNTRTDAPTAIAKSKTPNVYVSGQLIICFDSAAGVHFLPSWCVHFCAAFRKGFSTFPHTFDIRLNLLSSI